MPTVVKPSLLQVLALPFWPPFWRAAAGWSWGPVLAALFLVTLGSTGLAGLVLGIRGAILLETEAAAWDASWDPIVIEDGVLRVEGPRVYTSADGRVVVDAEDNLDLDAVMGKSLVLRREEMVQIRAFDRRVYRYDNLLSMIDARSVRFDSASLGAFAEKWDVALVAGSVLFIPAFFGTAYAIGALLLALAAAGLLGLWQSPTKPPFGARARVTLAICSLAPPVWVALMSVGMNTSCCIDIVVGPPLVALLAWLALRGAPPEV